VQNRAQEQAEAVAEWETNWKGGRMDGKVFLAELLVDSYYFTTALIDHGSSSYALVNRSFAQKHNLACFPIEKRDIIGITGKAGSITEACYFSLDLDGHRQERVYAYVVPAAQHDIVLGMPWIQHQQVHYLPNTDQLLIQASGITIRRETSRRTASFSIKSISAQSMAAKIRGEKSIRKAEQPRVFSASLLDIQKALEVKPKRSINDIRNALPEPYRKNIDAFAHDEEQLPLHREGLDMKIDLIPTADGNQPTLAWGPLYSMSREELLVLRRTLHELLDQGFIRVSSSSASSPVLFARKPGGGLRFCVDYRALNALTKKDRYPLPLIQETLRQIGSAKWLTKLDVRAAFHRLRIRPGDEWKTAFRTRYGLYEWVVCPFGLANAPSAFQRFINWVLRDYLDIFASAYIDDILIYTDGTLEDHRSKVNSVLQRLAKNGLRLDINKCEFEVQRCKYLGLIIDTQEGISMDPEKVAAIREWAAPTTIKGIRGFIGFANYYRDFIQDFSSIVRPLTALTKKDIVFEWSPECEDAFQTLKTRFLDGPALALWDPDAYATRIECDASGFAIGGCLSQKASANNPWRPIAFYSRKMTPAETNYGIHDKELLSIIAATERWHAELRGVERFDVITDHKNLEYFRQKRILTERQVRWMEQLESLPPWTAIHRPGRLSAVPDALSRQDAHDDHEERHHNREAQLWKPEWDPPSDIMTFVSLGSSTESEPPTIETPPVFDNPSLRQLWQQSLQYDSIYKEIRASVERRDRQFARHLVPAQSAQISDCEVDTHGRLTHRGRWWVPNYEPLRTTIIQSVHDSVAAGHPGREGTIAMLRRQFFWPQMSHDIRRFVQNCQVCGRVKIWRDRRHGLLQPLPIPQTVGAGISMDFMEKLPETDRGNSNILVITDRFSGAFWIIPLPNLKVQTIVKAFIERFYSEHGAPEWIVSDRGTQWIDGFWARLCEVLGVTRKLSTAFHPETDGATEKANQEVQAFLRAYVNFNQSDWDDWCPAAQLALNNRPSETRGGLSPYFILHGRDVKPIPELTYDSHKTSKFGGAESTVAKLRKINEWVSTALAANQQSMEEQANRHRKAPEQFKPGDEVWLNLKNIPLGRPSRKLDWQHAKYRVIKQVAPLVYELDVPTGIHNRFHAELLRRFPNNPFPSQVAATPRSTIQVDGEDEWELEEILCAFGQGDQRVAWCKWTGWQTPAATDLENVADTAALDAFEAKYGKIEKNDGPAERYLTKAGRLRAAWKRFGHEQATLQVATRLESPVDQG
jgi:hypothetical protein